jgi:hypothetical protein
MLVLECSCPISVEKRIEKRCRIISDIKITSNAMPASDTAIAASKQVILVT